MAKGSTSTSNNAPPQQFLDAYSNVLQRAQGVANTPYTPYPGQLQAGFSPMQQQGFNVISSAPGVSAPYINQAAQDFTNANTPLAPQIAPYVGAAQGQFQQAAGANLQGALSPYQTAAGQGFAGGSQAINPNQYSGQAIQGFESPYTQQVINATQQQFNTQNAQAQTGLRGNAASQGALGGDRLGVAQAQLAGQQQMAQAPVIAGLQNQGFAQAQQEFNQQQGVDLSAQQNTAARQLQGAQGYAGLGGQSLTAAQQQAAIQQQAGAGFASLGQQELSAAQGQNWLAAQSGAGMAGLGNQALSSTLSSGNALLGAGGQQQAFAQQGLNIPYQQFLAQQAYPFQTTGWLSNIAQGLGSGAGGTASSTVPGPSALSQVGGLGVAGAGLYGAGAFNGLFGSSGAGGTGIGVNSSLYNAPIGPTETGAPLNNRGGRIGFAGGGGVPGADDVTVDGVNVPDAGTSIVPDGAVGGSPLIKRNYGTTTHSSGGDSIFGTLVKTIGGAAASYWGGPAGAIAANELASNTTFRRGGTVGFANGGDIVPNDGSTTPGQSDITQGGPPDQRPSWVPQLQQARHGAGPPRAPAYARPENLGDEATKWVGDAKAAGVFGKRDTSNYNPGFAGGGSVPILPQGFAAGGSPAISVTSVPNARGVGVPTMTVNPDTGSASQQLSDYLAQTQAGAFVPPKTAAPAAAPAAPAPDPNALTASQSAMLQQFLAQRQQQMQQEQIPQGGGNMQRGGTIQGFAGGGDTGGDGYGQPPDDTAPASWITNEPVGSGAARWWAGQRQRMDADFAAKDAQRAAIEAADPALRAAIKQRFDQSMTPGFDLGHVTNQPVGQKFTNWWNSVPPVPQGPELRGRWPDGPADPELRGRWPAGAADPEERAGPELRGSFPAGGFASPAVSGDSGGGAQPGVINPSAPQTIGGITRGSPPPGGYGGNPLLGDLTVDGTGDGNAGSQDTQRGPPPPPQRDPSAGFYADALAKSRAVQEDKANPWLALATAGFGMMAGQSPHALTNVGTGALAGMNQFVSADRSAKELAARVAESASRLAESQAYHEATIGTRNYGIDTRAQTANDRTNQMMAITMAKIAAQADRAGQHVTTADLIKEGADSLIGQTNPKTGQPYTAVERLHEANNVSATNDFRQQRSARDDRRLDMLEDHRAWQEQHGDATLEQQREHYADLKAKGASDQDLKALGMSKDIMGKETMTGRQAHDQAQGVRDLNKPGGTTAPNSRVTLPPAQTDRPDPATLPEGAIVTQGGVQYRKQDGAWVPN